MVDQVNFDAVPLVGIGPVHLGMTRQDVRSALSGPVSSFAHWQAAPNSTDAFLGHSFQVDYDAAGEVHYIELSRSGPFSVFYKGTNVFATEAEQLVAYVSLDAPCDAANPELGSSYIFPHLALSLWRENVPDDLDEGCDLEDNDGGRFFDTIGVGNSGYYEKPI